MNVNLNNILKNEYQTNLTGSRTKKQSDFSGALTNNTDWEQNGVRVKAEETAKTIQRVGVNVVAQSRLQTARTAEIVNTVGVQKTVEMEKTAGAAAAEQFIPLADSDYSEAHPESGYLFKARVDAAGSLVYVEKKYESGTSEHYQFSFEELSVSRQTIDFYEPQAALFADAKEDATMIALKAWARAEERQAKRERAEEENPLHKAIFDFKGFVEERVKSGDPKYAIGSGEFSNKEWDGLMSSIDAALANIRAEMEERQAKEQLKKDAGLQISEKDRIEAQAAAKEKSKERSRELLDKLSDAGKAPYHWLANENNQIVYNGVTFFCDDEKRTISLGDTSNPDKVLSIPFSGGGTLCVNRDNIDDLSKAIGMFSPEDVKRILQAITTDAQCRRKLLELEEEKENSDNFLTNI